MTANIYFLYLYSMIQVMKAVMIELPHANHAAAFAFYFPRRNLRVGVVVVARLAFQNVMPAD
jgi:hypothetical protein